MAKRRGTKSTRNAKGTKPKTAKRKAVRRAAKKAAAPKRAAKRPAARKAPKRTAARKAPAKKTAARKSSKGVKKVAKTVTRKAVKKSPARASARKATPKPRQAAPAKATRRAPKAVVATRKAPALNRERRVVGEDDIVLGTPPSSLDLDRTASSARSGRRELAERFAQHNESSPALTAGDVDADWEGAYASGDEAPGGDNPTPDQDIVDDIGRAVGIEYQDNEELKGVDKVTKRDEHRWELDPASSEDYDDRD